MLVYFLFSSAILFRVLSFHRRFARIPRFASRATLANLVETTQFREIRRDSREETADPAMARC